MQSLLKVALISHAIPWVIGAVNVGITEDAQCSIPIFNVNGQYFSFDTNSVDLVLGRNDWNDSTLSVYNERVDETVEIRVW